MVVFCGGVFVVWDLIRCDVKDRFFNLYGLFVVNLYLVYDMFYVFLVLFIFNDFFLIFML